MSTLRLHCVAVVFLIVLCGCRCGPIRHSLSLHNAIWLHESLSRTDYQHPALTRCSEYSREHRCQTYQCVAQQTGCSSVERSVAYKFCIAVHNSHPHHHHQQQQQQHLLHSDVLAWAQRTNDCLTQRVVEHLVDEQTQCASVELTMRADLHACTRLSDVTTCRQLLLLHRRDTVKLFSHISWMSVVEMTRLCPRDVMASFITWALNGTAENSTPRP